MQDARRESLLGGPNQHPHSGLRTLERALRDLAALRPAAAGAKLELLKPHPERAGP